MAIVSEYNAVEFGGDIQNLEWGLTEEDLTNTLVNHESSPLLFGVVEGETVLEDLRTNGTLEKLEERGYHNFRVDKSSHVQYGDRFLLWATHRSDHTEYALFDIRTRFAEIDWGENRIKALFWEWLGFQDPKAEFDDARLALPGQDHPGLGVFRDCTDLMHHHLKDTQDASHNCERHRECETCGEPKQIPFRTVIFSKYLVAEV